MVWIPYYDTTRQHRKWIRIDSQGYTNDTTSIEILPLPTFLRTRNTKFAQLQRTRKAPGLDRIQGSVVGIATTLQDGRSVIRIPAGASSPKRPDRLWRPTHLSNGYWGYFPGGKAAGARS
jgi:hypothetical protein